MPANAHPIAAMRNEITTAGPALLAAAIPVSENRPAPMIAPIPSAIRLIGPSVRFSECSESSDSSLMRLKDLVAKRFILPPFFPCEIDRHSQQHNHQTRESVVWL